MQSGVSLSLWGLSRRVPQILNQVAVDLGIDNSTTRAIVDGLKELEVDYLQSSASSTITSVCIQR